MEKIEKDKIINSLKKLEYNGISTELGNVVGEYADKNNQMIYVIEDNNGNTIVKYANELKKKKVDIGFIYKKIRVIKFKK